MPEPSELQHVLACSGSFYEALHATLGETLEVATPRDLLTQGTCSTAIEHGVSVFLLVQAGNVASAIALLRPQFEAVVRALWLHEVADDGWIERYLSAAKANPTKEPNPSPKVDKLLEALAPTRHAPAVRMLAALKDAAWGPLNSYVHSGLHPVLQQHAGFPPEYAIQTVRNSNGLAGMAATLMAIAAGNLAMATGVRRAQIDHLDCLPPLNPIPAPPPGSHAIAPS